MLKGLLTTAAIAALATTAAFAGPCGQDGEPVCPGYAPVLNEQIQLGNVWGNMEVVMPDRTSQAVGTSAAYGNVTSNFRKMGQIDFRSTQVMEGDAAAQTYIETGDVDGAVIGTSTAYSNSATAGTWDGNANYFVEQTADGRTSARTVTRVESATDVALGTSAAANVSAVEAEYGKIANFTRQDANGSVIAETNAEVLFQSNSGQAVTTALGNSMASTGYGTSSFNGAVQSTAAGEVISAATTYYSANANGSTIGASTAAGNTALVTNAYGPAGLGRDGSELFQGNLSTVSATSFVNLDSWSGIASSSAYGVGNSALIGNVGGETSLFGIQSNFGDVSSSARLAGNSYAGGTGLVTSTAIGNAASAYGCSTCGSVPVYGNISQFNAGDVTAYGRAYTPVAGGVIGSAVAVGNTATYQSTGQGH